MSDQEQKRAEKITGYLDRSAADLRPGVAYRLQRARAEALARLAEPERAARLAPALAGHRSGTAGSGGRSVFHPFRFWLAIAIVASALFGTQQWHQYQEAKELAEIDSQILTSDLPIDAYLDRGFQNWLRGLDSD